MSSEEWKEWFNLKSTKEFFKLISTEKDTVLDSMVQLTTCGDELVKDFYKLQGLAEGISAAYSYAEALTNEGT